MLTPVLPQGPGDAHSRHLIDAAGGEVPYGSRVPCLHAAWVCHVTSLDLGFLICKMRDFPEMKSPLSPEICSKKAAAPEPEAGEAVEVGLL